MKQLLLTVGKASADYASSGIARYVKLLKPYHGCEVRSVRAARAAGGRTHSQLKHEEGGRILDALKPKDLVWVLDGRGKPWSSMDWAKRLDEARMAGRPRLVLVIGGAVGLSSEVIGRATHRVSLGPITLPHELAAVVALEQLFRAHTILAGTPYHRA